MILTDLGPELHDLAVAIGLLDGTGSLRTAWFANPLGQAGALFRDPARRAALSDHIRITAGIFDPAAVSLVDHNRGCNAIEKVAIMAHQQQGPWIVRDHFLQ